MAAFTNTQSPMRNWVNDVLRIDAHWASESIHDGPSPMRNYQYATPLSKGVAIAYCVLGSRGVSRQYATSKMGTVAYWGSTTRRVLGMTPLEGRHPRHHRVEERAGFRGSEVGPTRASAEGPGLGARGTRDVVVTLSMGTARGTGVKGRSGREHGPSWTAVRGRVGASTGSSYVASTRVHHPREEATERGGSREAACVVAHRESVALSALSAHERDAAHTRREAGVAIHRTLFATAAFERSERHPGVSRQGPSPAATRIPRGHDGMGRLSAFWRGLTHVRGAL